MANIPIYERQIGADQAIPGRRATGEDFGAGIGDAMRSLGNTMEGVSRQLEEKRKQDEMFSVRKDMAQVRSDWEKRFEEESLKAEAGAPDFTKNFTKQYEESMQKMRDDRVHLSKEAQQTLELMQIDYGGSLLNQSMSFESQSRASKLKMDAQAMETDSTRMIFNSPGKFGYEKKQYDDMVDGLNLPANAKAELKMSAANKMAISGINGFIERGQLGAAQKALKSGPMADEISGEQAAVLKNRIDAAYEQLKAKKNAIATEARAAMVYAKDRMLKGFELPPEEDARLLALAKASGRPEIERQYTLFKSLQQDQLTWRKLTPEGLQNVITKTLEPDSRQEGTTEYEFERLNAARTLLDGMYTQVKEDPLGWASSQGIVSIGGLDMKDPTSIKARAGVAEAVRETYGRTEFFTPIELEQQKEAFDKMRPIDKVAYVNNLQGNAGSLASTALKQLSKTHATDAYIGALALASPISGEKAWRGLSIITEDKARAPSVEKTAVIFRSMLGNSISELNPTSVEALRKTADAIYVSSGADPTEINEEAYKTAIREALGGPDGQKGTGLIQNYNGAPVLLPPKVSENEFENYVNNSKYIDWEKNSISGAGPTYSDGTPVDPEDIAKVGQFVRVSASRYAIRVGDTFLPDKMGDRYEIVLTPEIIRKNKNVSTRR